MYYHEILALPLMWLASLTDPLALPPAQVQEDHDWTTVVQMILRAHKAKHDPSRTSRLRTTRSATSVSAAWRPVLKLGVRWHIAIRASPRPTAGTAVAAFLLSLLLCECRDTALGRSRAGMPDPPVWCGRSERRPAVLSEVTRSVRAAWWRRMSHARWLRPFTRR